MYRERGFRAGLFAGAMLLVASATAARAECRLERGREHVVTKVIDGETLRLDDASEVRLIGALAPRAGDAGVDGDETAGGDVGRWPAEEAAVKALEALVAGRPVQLKFGGERRDRHDRWLAQVFVKNANETETWVQTEMLRQGHARAYAMQGNRACEAELIAAEAHARGEALGIWTIPTYRVRDSIYPRDLGRSPGSFRVITGTVRFVSNRREGYRLWLDGEGRRGEVTVAIRSSDRDVIGALGGDPKTLLRRRVEVRGWMDQRRGTSAGPEIDVSTAGIVRLRP